jgi:hypothetical protein
MVSEEIIKSLVERFKGNISCAVYMSPNGKKIVKEKDLIRIPNPEEIPPSFEDLPLWILQVEISKSEGFTIDLNEKRALGLMRDDTEKYFESIKFATE